MTSVTPSSLVNHGGSSDTALALTTLQFGHRNPGEHRPILYYRNPGQEDNEFDMVTGIVGPKSRMVTDGLGRTTMDFNAVGEPSELQWPF